MTPAQRKALNLPKTFYVAAYRGMEEWLRDKATMNPPHARDTSDPNDQNYSIPLGEEYSSPHGGGVIPDYHGFPTGLSPGYAQGAQGSPIDLTSTDSPVISTGNSRGGGTPPHVRRPLHPTMQSASTVNLQRGGGTFSNPVPPFQDLNLNAPPSPIFGTQMGAGGATPHTSPVSAPAGCVPPVSRQGRRLEEVHVLSSSATSTAGAELRKSMGNTGVRKKRSIDTTSIADGVMESAEKMVKVLGEINETQRTTEKAKLETHAKHFMESLEYKRERDRMLMENARIAQEQARLGLMNQQMVVHALASLASAIGRSVSPMGPPPTPNPAPEDSRPTASPSTAPTPPDVGDATTSDAM
ncbi:hypothetical protein KC19_7G157900 [Ceratodon purpureus]|uniref:Uncharacterized protein n=1 Tax=Ceratodon purpureus TaxID=3225 RepID=A0A8T0HA75_CERPU|nr:hypothetical protein KC19_7G157900 [Ceratodon purpureus]